MSRDLSTAFTEEITGETVRPIFLTQYQFDSGNVNFWTGYGDLEFESTVFTGSGDLHSMSPVVETETVRASGTDFALTGIPTSLISIALAEDYQERRVKLWFGLFDRETRTVSASYLLMTGRMDVMEIEESGETASIRLSVENRLVDLERARIRRYTPEDQKSDYPSDTFFDFVTELQDAEVIWGRR